MESSCADIKALKITNGQHEEFLFDQDLITGLDWSESKKMFDPAVSPTSPGENLVIRPLSTTDYEKGFPQVLSHLTKVGDVSEQDFLDSFHKMKSCKNSYYVTVIEDTSLHRIVGAATLLVEQKFIRECALRCRIEDVVVDSAYRGKQLGKLIVETVKQLGNQHVGCYKISLDCHDHMVKFYEQHGLKREEGNSNAMVHRFRT